MKCRSQPTLHGVWNGIDAGSGVSEDHEGEKDTRCPRLWLDGKPGEGDKKHGDDAATRQQKPEEAGGPQRGFRLGGRLHVPGRFPPRESNRGSPRSFESEGLLSLAPRSLG